MISEIVENNKLAGFSYYPILEICLGVFFLFMSFCVPLLFAKYNGFKFLEQWDEWLFLLIFFFVFLLLGKSLTWQKLTVKEENGTINFFQNLRSPEVSIECKFEDWIENRIVIHNYKEKDPRADNLHEIILKLKHEERQFYVTKSKKEAQIILDNLNKLQASLKRR